MRASHSECVATGSSLAEATPSTTLTNEENKLSPNRVSRTDRQRSGSFRGSRSRRAIAIVILLSCFGAIVAFFPSVAQVNYDVAAERGSSRTVDAPLPPHNKGDDKNGGGVGGQTGYGGAPSADDLVLRLPNWRRANIGHERSPPGNDDDDEVRVMVGIVSTRKSELFCSALASAYLSGLPAVVMGFGQRYTNFLDKARTAVRVFRGAGLRPRDVVMVLDEDILFSSGVQLTAALDRFIALSPESPAELDARAVRDGRGTMLAPVLFGAEEICRANAVLRKTPIVKCAWYFNITAETALDMAAHAAFPASHRAVNTNHLRYPNGGVVVARMWAFEEYVEALGVAQARHKPAVVGGTAAIDSVLYGTLIRFESITGTLEQTSNTTAAVGGGSGGVAPRSGPYGLRPGLIGLDHAGHFSAAPPPRGRPGTTVLTDALWRRWRGAAHPTAALLRTWLGENETITVDVTRTDAATMRLPERADNVLSKFLPRLHEVPLLHRQPLRRETGADDAIAVTPPFLAVAPWRSRVQGQQQGRHIAVNFPPIIRLSRQRGHVTRWVTEAMPWAIAAGHQQPAFAKTVAAAAAAVNATVFNSSGVERYLHSQTVHLWSDEGHRKVAFREMCPMPLFSAMQDLSDGK